MGKVAFDGSRMRVALAAYSALTFVGLPFVLCYLHWRGRRDRLYAQHVGERLGRVQADMEGCVWVHAASLGEVRSAAPLIDLLLGQSERIVVTVHTPAGRREAQRLYGKEIEEGRLCVVYAPLELKSAWRGFFRAFRPRCGLVMEIEMWPLMIACARARGVPLFMCNAQYPTSSLARDRKRFPLRTGLVSGFAGVFAKSEGQAERFRSLGARQVAVTGEMRFDQEVPKPQLAAGKAARKWLSAAVRPCVSFISVIEGEEDTYLEVMDRIAKGIADRKEERPLFVVVPRAPERFGDVAAILEKRGVACGRRSALFDGRLKPRGDAPAIDALLGDSLGEVHFYMAMSDAVVVGGGFSAKGAHNVIEALSQGKPVFVGPETHTIEYPLAEALEEGVATRTGTAAEMAEALSAQLGKKADRKRIAAFCRAHGEAARRTLEALPGMIEGAGLTRR